MSLLSDIEASIITKLVEATVGGQPLFATVRGASGPVRAGLRQGLSRERTPAAYVVYLHEKLAPEDPATEKGPRFAMLLAERVLRQGDDPRNQTIDARGLFDLIAQTRTLLDGHSPLAGKTLVALVQHMVESDDRQAIAQITYIVRAS